MGAPDPRTKPRPSRQNGKGRSIWSFKKPKFSRSSGAENDDWSQTPIDNLSSPSWKRKAFAPSPPADKRTLIRRATFDLIGLPPTPRRDRRVRRGHLARRVREGGRPAAGLAALRRTLGPLLARRGPLRRHARATSSRKSGSYPYSLHVSRLGHPRVQRGPAVRPVHHRAARRRPACRRRRQDRWPRWAS